MNLTAQAIRDAMLELEKHGDQDPPDIDQVMARILKVAFTPEFEAAIVAEYQRIREIMGWHVEQGHFSAQDPSAWLMVAFTQGITFAEAVRELRDG